MPYVCDLRSYTTNNVIALPDKLYIEGQEVTPTNLAPVPFSQGPANASAFDGGLAMRWVYRRTSNATGAQPRGMINSARITCGNDAMTDFVKSPNLGFLYGGGFANNTTNQYSSTFKALGYTSITVGGMTIPNTDAGTAKIFLPFASSSPSDGGWIVINAYSTLTPDTAANAGPFVVGTTAKLAENGVVTAINQASNGIVSTPYVGSEAVVVVGTPWASTATVNDSTYATKVYAINRLTGVVTMATVNWIPAATTSTNGRGCFPSNAVVETPGSQVYFYHPILTNAALTIYVGTISSLSGTPTISAIAGNTLTAVGGGALDTSAVVYPAAPSSNGGRQVRLWVIENSGNRYLNMLVYEPGTGTTVSTAATDLYIWQLNSKLTATFLQKVNLGTAFGRVRGVLPTDTSQKTVAVIFDTNIAFYGWNSATNWTLLSSQGVQAQEVGVDHNGRVWVSSLSDYSSTTPQTLSVFEPAGAATNITLTFDSNRYTYSGSPISGNLTVNAYDVAGNRVAISVTLTRSSQNFQFSGGASSTVITTSAGGNTTVPISVIGSGRLLCVAAPT